MGNDKQQNNYVKRVWCETHPTGYIGKDQFGKWYAQCTYGNLNLRKGEPSNCRLIFEKETTGNGTPYSDEQWKKWYTNHKSSDEEYEEH